MLKPTLVGLRFAAKYINLCLQNKVIQSSIVNYSSDLMYIELKVLMQQLFWDSL